MGEARRPAGSTKGGQGDPEKNLEVTSSRAAALEAPVHVEDSYVIVERSGSRWEEGESRKT